MNSEGRVQPTALVVPVFFPCVPLCPLWLDTTVPPGSASSRNRCWVMSDPADIRCVQLMYNVYIMPESSVLTLRLDAKLKSQLDRLSKSMNRSRSFVAAQAIQEYVSVNEWQIGEIKKALVEADQGDFASDKEMQQTIRRLTRRAR